ncbi:SymE family type I addiction module toxin [Steroidobacter agaridevorans]|uniref:SymE family type I addiction module toxin n=1 Tax=Steroidobacter agaridevorans TaxID=2695856 RepID=UPI00137A478F|nr:SymE family type I addiction module toxin [Steroidobacter agaridevorans]
MPRSTPPSSRQLKVSPSRYDVHSRHWPPPPVPFIRLRGYWLEKAGFGVDQRVNIQVSDGCITLVPADA